MKYLNILFALSLLVFPALFAGCGDDGEETLVTSTSEEDEEVIAFNTDDDGNSGDASDGHDSNDGSDSGNGDDGNGSNNGSIDCQYDAIELTIEDTVESNLPSSDCENSIVLRSRGDEATASFVSSEGEVVLTASFRWEFRYVVLGYTQVETIEADQSARFRFTAIGGSSPSEVTSSRGFDNGDLVINLEAKQPPEMAFFFRRL